MKIILGSGSPRRREILTGKGIEYEVVVSDCDENIAPCSPEEYVERLSRRKAAAVADKIRADWTNGGKTRAVADKIRLDQTGGGRTAAGGQEEAGMDKAVEDAGITGKKQLIRGATDEDGAKGAETYIIIGADTVVVQDGEILGKPADRDDAKRMIRRLQGGRHQVYTGVTLYCLPFEELSVTFAECTDVLVRGMSEEEIIAYTQTGECDDKAGAYAIQGQFSVYIDHFEGDYLNVVGLPADRVVEELEKMKKVINQYGGRENGI